MWAVVRVGAVANVVWHGGRRTMAVTLDRFVQHVLAADRREDDVAYDAVGPLDRGLGNTEQQAGLARDAAKVGQQLLLDGC